MEVQPTFELGLLLGQMAWGFSFASPITGGLMTFVLLGI